jgi:hypothetical protein
MCESVIPFGLLFLEKETACAEQPLGAYDEDQDVSVLDVNGEVVPLVKAVGPRMSTETLTEVAGEATDPSSHGAGPPWWLGTDTETKAQDDLTSGAVEPSLAIAMGTETGTSIGGEETD